MHTPRSSKTAGRNWNSRCECLSLLVSLQTPDGLLSKLPTASMGVHSVSSKHPLSHNLPASSGLEGLIWAKTKCISASVVSRIREGVRWPMSCFLSLFLVPVKSFCSISWNPKVSQPMEYSLVSGSHLSCFLFNSIPTFELNQLLKLSG